MAILLKSIFHNVGVVLVGFALAYLGTMVDSILGFPAIASALMPVAGWSLLALGFLLRRWATVYFYRHGLRQAKLKLCELLGGYLRCANSLPRAPDQSSDILLGPSRWLWRFHFGAA